MATPNEGENTELVIGLVGPIGTNLKAVKKVLSEELGKTGYSVEEIKISEDVIDRVVDVKKDWKDKVERYQRLIKAGNESRARAKTVDSFDGDPDAVLAFGVADKIQQMRSRTAQGDCGQCSDVPEPNFQTAYIVDSLKRPEEVEWLRQIYPDGFILVGVFESEEDRKKHLCGESEEDMSSASADLLIADDHNQENEKHGQRVVKTFHLADFFLHLKRDSAERLKCDVERLIALWFGQPHTTPTFDEYAMYMAFAASLRTADLSRQVGAVVSKSKEILSTGANECPKAGGGLYWPVRFENCIGDEPDGRDFIRGEDSNKKAVAAIVNEVLLAIDDVVKSPNGQDVNLDETLLRKRLEKSTIGDLTEFGRVVHAEMEAILACARNNISTRDATLFCTTFPCHNCAKHIVAAGIQRVVYIEPYAKSRAFEFHTDSILSADPGQLREQEEKTVFFEPFVGVGPRRYLDLFSMKQGAGYSLVRKTADGDTIKWDVGKARLRLQMKPTSYLDSETEASDLFRSLIE